MVWHSPLSPVFGLKLDHSYRLVCAQSRKKLLPTGFKLRRCVLCICEQRQAFKTACFYLPPFILDEHGFRVCLGKVAKLILLRRTSISIFFSVSVDFSKSRTRRSPFFGGTSFKFWRRCCFLRSRLGQPAAKGAGSASKSGQGGVLVTPHIDRQNTRTIHAQLRMYTHASV